MDDCVERGLLGGFEHGLEGGVLEHGLIGLASELVVDGVGRLCGGCRNVEPRRFCPWPRDPNNGIVAGADNKAAPDEWKSSQTTLKNMTVVERSLRVSLPLCLVRCDFLVLAFSHRNIHANNFASPIAIFPPVCIPSRPSLVLSLPLSISSLSLISCSFRDISLPLLHYFVVCPCFEHVPRSPELLHLWAAHRRLASKYSSARVRRPPSIQ